MAYNAGTMGVNRVVMNVGEGSAFVKSVCKISRASEDESSGVASEVWGVSSTRSSATTAEEGSARKGRCRRANRTREMISLLFWSSDASIRDKANAIARL